MRHNLYWFFIFSIESKASINWYNVLILGWSVCPVYAVIKAEDYSRLNQKIDRELSDHLYLADQITQSNDDINKALLNSILTVKSLNSIYEKADV